MTFLLLMKINYTTLASIVVLNVLNAIGVRLEQCTLSSSPSVRYECIVAGHLIGVATGMRKNTSHRRVYVDTISLAM